VRGKASNLNRNIGRGGGGERALTDESLAIGLDHRSAHDGASHDEEVRKEPCGLHQQQSTIHAVN
jgi:hypothetical protein